MKIAMRLKSMKIGIAERLATRHPAKLVLALALGALLLGGTALHFAPDRGDEMPARPLSQDNQIIPDDERVQGLPYVDDFRADEAASPENSAWAKKSQEETVAMKLLRLEAPTSDEAAFLLDEVNDGAMAGVQAWEQYSQSTRVGSDNSYDREKVFEAFLIERLERRMDSLLAEAALDPSWNTSQLNREIERLDYQIDMLRVASRLHQ